VKDKPSKMPLILTGPGECVRLDEETLVCHEYVLGRGSLGLPNIAGLHRTHIAFMYHQPINQGDDVPGWVVTRRGRRPASLKRSGDDLAIGSFWSTIQDNDVISLLRPEPALSITVRLLHHERLQLSPVAASSVLPSTEEAGGAAHMDLLRAVETGDLVQMDTILGCYPEAVKWRDGAGLSALMLAAGSKLTTLIRTMTLIQTLNLILTQTIIPFRARKCSCCATLTRSRTCSLVRL